MSKTLPSFVFPKEIGRVDFRRDGFRRMIQHNGMDVTWEMASECPCVDSGEGLGLTLDTGLSSLPGLTQQAQTDCPSCGGRGYRHHSAQTIRALVLTMSNEPERSQPQGDYAQGTVNVTTLPEHRLSWGDRITLQESVIRYRETKVYAGEAISDTRYPVFTRELRTDPPQQVGVIDIYAADLTNLAPLNNEKVEGVDFTVNGSGQIVWVNPPDNGARWAISYYANPVYVVTDLPHPVRDTRAKIKVPSAVFTSLPLKAVCTLEFLATGEGAS